MTEHIFKSKYSLRMKSASLEKSYNESQSKSANCWINILSVIGLLSTVINVLLQIYLVSDKINSGVYPFPEILNLSYLSTATNTVLSLIIVLITNSKYKRLLYYVQYLFMGCAFFCIKFSISFYEIDPKGEFNLYGLESLTRILNNFGFFEFLDCIVMTLADVILDIFLFILFQKGNFNGFILPYLLFTLGFIIVSYVIVYTRKISFYYSEQNKKERDWFKKIIENFESGFISVKENKICLINEVMWEIIQKNIKIMRLIKETQGRRHNNTIQDNGMISKKFLEVEENSRLVLNELLKDFSNQYVPRDINQRVISEIDNLVIPGNDSRQNLNNFSHYDYLNIPPCDGNKIAFLESFKKTNLKNDNKFIFIGTKTLEIESDSEDDFLSLEVYCSYHNNIDTKKDEFEIFFKDVTKAKQIEEKKYEMKYKSIFLSKVAHEFKNPLICIIELVNQLSEKFKQMKDNENDMIMEFEDSLNQINSFSNYLMILIKDLDYFSQKEIHSNKISIEKIECELKEILKFCNDIGTSLLKKTGKDKRVSLQIEAANDVPEIIKTDESRLKQVLVNMLSNSIKFTNQGSVKLKAFKEQLNLVFCVSDTGVGIEEKKKKNLFSPFNSFTRSNAVNPHGSGLGMSIVHDITVALGKQIEFKSEVNKGSDFFFSIPIETKKNIKASSKSLNSYEHNHFEIQENSKTTRTSSTIKNIAKNYFSLNNCIIKTNTISSMKRVRRKNSEIKSLFCENPKSKFEENRTKNFKYSEVSHQGQDNFSHNSYSDINDSLLDIEERSLTSIRDISKRNIIFLDTKSISNISPTCNMIESSLHLINSDNEKEMNLSNAKNNSFTLEINKKETKKVGGKDKFHLNLNNDDLLNEFKFKTFSRSSRNQSKTSELLSEFIDDYQHLINLKDLGYINIVLVDDERLTRLSNKRMISNFAMKKNLKVNFIEAEDGFECLYLLYICIQKGIKISCVISDQTMNFLNGTSAAIVLRELAQVEALRDIPFYISSAFDDQNNINKMKSAPVTKICSKPLKISFLEELFQGIKE